LELIDEVPAKGEAMARRGIPRGVCTLDDIMTEAGRCRTRNQTESATCKGETEKKACRWLKDGGE
jgi:hypothetical protein